jgi:hypothetical protein
MKKSILILVTSMLSLLLSSNAFANGGEDWPFKCTIEGSNDVEEFFVYQSNNRSSGYELSFYDGLNSRQVMEVFLEKDVTGDFLVFSGCMRTALGVIVRHMKGYIQNSKSMETNSFVKFKLSLSGRRPDLEDELLSAFCTRAPEAVEHEMKVAFSKK